MMVRGIFSRLEIESVRILCGGCSFGDFTDCGVSLYLPMLTIRQQHTLYLSSVSKHALLVLGCANTVFIFIFLPARKCFFCVYSLPSVWLAIIFERSPQLNSYINYCFGGRQGGFTMGVMHIGAPACGMNAAVRSFVRNCIYRGDIVYGIHDGVEGLIEGNVSYPTEEKLEEKKN